MVKGPRVLVRPLPLEETAGTEVKFIIARTNVKAERAAVEQGEVIDVGPLAWNTDDLGEKGPWCAVGDIVLFAKYAGHFVNDPNFPHDDSKQLVFLDEKDIIAVVEEVNE